MTTREDHALGQLIWASEPRLNGSINEDRVSMTDNAVWVLDGAGTPSGVTSCCDADASWYVDQLSEALAVELRDARDVPLRDALRSAITRVQAAHTAICPMPDSGRGPSSTVAVARRRETRLDVLVLGDSPIVLDHGSHVAVLTDTRLAGVARPLRQQIKAALGAGNGYDDPAHHRRRRQLVDAERTRRNRFGGFWIAADDPAAAAHAMTSSYSIGDPGRGVSRVLLMSDGVHRASTILGVYQSDAELLEAVASAGPETCIQQIRAAEADDPRGEQYPRTKLSDDATLVLWTVSGRVR